jgi:hypothetical protein
MNIPIDQYLYNKVKKMADVKFTSKTGIYRSSWIVKKYKELGGKYSGKKNINKGLLRWFQEDWVDLNRPIKKNGKIIGYESCGRKNTNDRTIYPLCRPLKKITKDTPRTLQELTNKEINKAKKNKNILQRTNHIKFKFMHLYQMVVKFKDRIDFTPDYTPEQMFNLGVFSNGYFRPVYSSVLKKIIKNDYKKYKCLKNVPIKLMTYPFSEKGNETELPYKPEFNKYKVKTGTTLEFWEQSGWIVKGTNERGWVGWYCGFYDGKRTPDDERQIKRWKNIKTRFGKRKNKSQIIKQLLLQWAVNYEKI